MPLGTEVDVGPGDIVSDGDPAPPPKREHSNPHFSAHVYCGHTFPHLSYCWALACFLAYSQQSQIGCLPHFHRWCILSANFECSSKMCCTRLAQRRDAKITICVPSHNFVGLYLSN